jgi:predicted nucleic acid-binding protein
MYRKPSRTDASRKALTALAFVAERFPTVYPVEADRQVAIATLGRYLDQKLTLTDATIAAMASREGAAVLTFDRHHFGLMGVEVFS